ncbi:TPA: UDP-N-acetylmuramoyl-L-alanyl-D-glutamate--2,6-diaminopimelate ligase [Candidatus Poribacteria bacterium]|nr:UDP-N-acetylmuramoyl-L-alanyl-D-glutamate--2,6-diaminopimelate ligase [Candidatus Poribacteria bacterium]
MKLQQLLNGINVISIVGNLDREIDGIAHDSRRVEPNFVFISYRGVAVDGHEYISDAIEKGATAIISEKDLSLSEAKELSLPKDITWMRVKDGRLALSLMAANWYNVPAAKLRLIGITGTNGKTSTAHLIEAIFTAGGFKMGIMGSIGHKFGDKFLPAMTTTPDSLKLQQLLSEMVDDGMDGVVMEVTSHSLTQKRVAGIQFDVAVFTNLTQDHLDFHKNMQSYLDAKVELFKQLKKDKGRAILNADDDASQYIIRRLESEQSEGTSIPNGRSSGIEFPLLTYGVEKPADLYVQHVNSTLSNLKFTVITPKGEIDVNLKLLGEYNLYNALAAAGVGLSCGIELDAIKTGLESAVVPGRFELVDCGQDFAVVVDYAHTPDALERLLTASQKITEGRLICVFGCGGDRDRGKRPIMGGIASEIADHIIITSDNPRTEVPAQITAAIEAGVKPGRSYDVIVDRRSAIERGIEIARSGDIVVIAGKGHENYQDFGNKRIPFDDREVAAEYIAKRLRM